MRILYVASFSEPTFLGGAERTLKTLVDGMQERGHEVRVISLRPGKIEAPVPDHTRLRPTRNLFVPDGARAPGRAAKLLWHGIEMWNPVASRDLAREIAEFRPDVVSCHNLAGWSVAVWGAAQRASVPVVQVLHDYYLMCLSGSRSRGGQACAGTCRACHLSRLPHRRLSGGIDGVVGISDHVLNVFRAEGFFEGVPAYRIYNAEAPMRVDLDRQRRPGPPIFGFLGRIAPHKGVEDLLAAFAAASLPAGAELWIAGSGAPDYVAALRAKAPRGVRFWGPQDAPGFLSGLDWSVVPSLSDEPLGRVVFESLGAGVPVIANRRGGIPEMMAAPEAGLLVQAGDVPGLSRALERAATDLGRNRQALAQLVQPFFDVPAFLDAYDAVYRKVITLRQAVRS